MCCTNDGPLHHCPVTEHLSVSEGPREPPAALRAASWVLRGAAEHSHPAGRAAGCEAAGPLLPAAYGGRCRAAELASHALEVRTHTLTHTHSSARCSTADWCTAAFPLPLSSQFSHLSTDPSSQSVGHMINFFCWLDFLDHLMRQAPQVILP